MNKAIILIFLITLLSCSKKEELTLMHWEGYAPTKVKKEFKRIIKEKYDIDLELKIIHPNNNDDILSSLKNENADIFVLSSYSLADPGQKIYENKYLTTIDITKISNIDLVIPQLLKLPIILHSKSYKALPIENQTARLISKSTISKKEQSWKLILDSKYKHLRSFEYVEDIMVQTALASNIPPLSIYNIEKLKKETSFLNNLSIVKNKYTQLWSEYTKEKDLKGANLIVSFNNIIEENTKEIWNYLIPKEGTNFSMEFIAIGARTLKSDQKSILAHEWINFTLSEFYQREIIMKQNKASPIIYKFIKPLTDLETKRFSFDKLHYYDKVILPSKTRIQESDFQMLWDSIK